MLLKYTNNSKVNRFPSEINKNALFLVHGTHIPFGPNALVIGARTPFCTIEGIIISIPPLFFRELRSIRGHFLMFVTFFRAFSILPSMLITSREKAPI